MRGDELRAVREERGMTGAEMASWLNGLTGRSYLKMTISKWETNRVKIPREIEGVLAMADLAYRRPAGRKSCEALTVAVALQKGGSAKTATSVCLAYVLARAGCRVLLVDADSQGNATLHVG